MAEDYEDDYDEPEGCTYPVGGVFEPPELCGGALDKTGDEYCLRHAKLERLGEQQARRQEAEADLM